MSRRLCFFLTLFLQACVTDIVLGAADGGDSMLEEDEGGGGTTSMGLDDDGTSMDGGAGDLGGGATIAASAQPGFPYRLFVRQWDTAAEYCAIVELETPTTVPPTTVEAPSPFGIVSMLAVPDASACDGIPGETPAPVLPSSASGEIAWSDGSPPFGMADIACALNVEVRLEFPGNVGVPVVVDMVAARLAVDGCDE